MTGSGGPHPNRLVTFQEVNFSRNWDISNEPYTSDGFVSWKLELDVADPTGTISITRSDGKVLSFNVTDVKFAVQMLGNVIRWSSYGDLFPGSDWPFQ